MEHYFCLGNRETYIFQLYIQHMAKNILSINDIKI